MTLSDPKVDLDNIRKRQIHCTTWSCCGLDSLMLNGGLSLAITDINQHRTLTRY